MISFLDLQISSSNQTEKTEPEKNEKVDFRTSTELASFDVSDDDDDTTSTSLRDLAKRKVSIPLSFTYRLFAFTYAYLPY